MNDDLKEQLSDEVFAALEALEQAVANALRTADEARIAWAVFMAKLDSSRH